MQIHRTGGVASRVSAERYHPGAAAVTFEAAGEIIHVVLCEDADAAELIGAAFEARNLLLEQDEEPPPHRFTRALDLPAPDACMVCGCTGDEHARTDAS